MTKKPIKKSNTKRPRGRPTKYTPEVVAELLKFIEDGNYAIVAAEGAGVCRDTFYEWLKVYPEFSDKVKKAESEAERFHVGRVKNGERAWTSSAWWLERKFPERWGRDRFTQEPEKDDDEVFYRTAIPDGGAIVIRKGQNPVEIYHNEVDSEKS